MIRRESMVQSVLCVSQPRTHFLGKNTGVGCHFLLPCMKVKMNVKSLSGVRPPPSIFVSGSGRSGGGGLNLA